MSAILDLNGSWKMVFDTNNQGLEQRWYVSEPEETENVTVPHTWEEEFGKYPGSIAFYYKDFFVPDTINPKRTLLRFQRAFFHSMVWVNGKAVGENWGGHQSFLNNIAKAVKPGEINQICIRVASEAASRINGVSIYDLPVSLPFLQKPFGGLWGDVELINGGKGSILNMNVSPNIDEEHIVVEMNLCNPRNYNAKLMFILTTPDGKVTEFQKETKLEKEDAFFKIQLGVKDVESWSPEAPNLYKLEVYLDKSFGVSKNFGFRKFDILRSEYYLNDKTFKIQGVVYNLSHPQSGGIQKSKTLLRKDLQNLKNTGFNVIRSGGAPLDETALEICDELGILVWQEMPMHNQRSTKEGLELAKTILDGLIGQQKTHPSIVAWVLGAENGTLLLENGTKLLRHAGELDHTRPVLSNLNSIYLDNEDQFLLDTGKVMGVTNDRILIYNSHRINPSMNLSSELSNFFGNYFCEDSSSEEVKDPTLGGATFRSSYDKTVRSNSSGRVLINLSSHTTIPDFKSVYKAYGKARTADNGKRLNAFIKEFNSFLSEGIASSLWSTPEDFADAVNPIALKATADRISTFLSSPLVNGYFIDCWADSNVLLNGFVDEFRNSKGAEEYLKELNGPSRLLITGYKRDHYEKETMSFSLKYLNGAKLDKAEAKLQIVDSKGKVQGKAITESITPNSVITLLETNSIALPSKAGSYFLETILSNGKTVLHSHQEEILVLKKAKVATIAKVSDLSAADVSKTKVMLANKPSQWNKSKAKAIAEAVSNGAKLVLHDLTPEEAEAFNALEIYPKTLKLANTTGSKTSAFHYWESKGLFAGTSSQIATSLFADVTPNYSWLAIPDSTIESECVCFTEEGEIARYVDVAEVKQGKGSILFHQFRNLDNAEQNPLAALLLNNI